MNTNIRVRPKFSTKLDLKCSYYETKFASYSFNMKTRNNWATRYI